MTRSRPTGASASMFRPAVVSRFLVIVVASPLSLTFALAALAQQGTAPPGAVFHQRNAGKMDATGWTVASSTEGGFQIKVRAKYTDFTAEEHKPNKPLTTTFGVSAVTPEGIRFLAARIRYPEGEAQLHIEQMDRSSIPEMLSVTPVLFKGWQARDVVVRNPVSITHMRMFVVGHDLFLLSVQLPLQLDNVSATLLPIFFDSFTLVKK